MSVVAITDFFEIGSSGILTWYIIALRDLPLEFLLATDDLCKKQFLKIGVGARHHSVDVFEIGSSGILTWYIIALRDLPQEFLHLSSLDLTFVLCKFMLTCLSAIS